MMTTITDIFVKRLLGSVAAHVARYAQGTGPSILGDRLRQATVRTICVQGAQGTAMGHWTNTPKFGIDDHFQRWRCAT